MQRYLINSILESELWTIQPASARVTLLTLIAYAVPDGTARFQTVAMLSRQSGLSLDETKTALASLCASNGERIPVTKVEGGWKVNDMNLYLKSIAAAQSAHLKTERNKRWHEEARKKKRPRKPKPPTSNDPLPIPEQPQTAAATEARVEAEEEAKKQTVEKVESEHHKLIAAWCSYYLALHSLNYQITGRDAKAAKDLLTALETSAKVMNFAKAVHARAQEGYPFTNSYTLYDLANNLNRLQAAMASKSAKPTLEGAREAHKGKLYPESFESLPVCNPNDPNFDPSKWKTPTPTA